jgi:hypothetical protein
LLGVWGALVASGCSLEDVDSDAIRTQGMFADILALAPGDSSTLVRVDLTVGGESGTKVTLVGDDRLEAQVGEVTEPLGRTGRGRYEEQITGDSAGEVTVRLLRGPEDASASASAFLPEPFSITLDSDASPGIRRDQEVVVRWAPPAAGGIMRWAIEGRCIWSESGETPDDGRVALGPESFRVRGTRLGDECEVAVSLERENTGSVESVLIPGSKFSAVQRRGLSIVSLPAPTEVGAAAPDAG